MFTMEDIGLRISLVHKSCRSATKISRKFYNLSRIRTLQCKKTEILKYKTQKYIKINKERAKTIVVLINYTNYVYSKTEFHHFKKLKVVLL